MAQPSRLDVAGNTLVALDGPATPEALSEPAGRLSSRPVSTDPDNDGSTEAAQLEPAGIASLPPPLLQDVLKCLAIADARTARLVCRAWAELVCLNVRSVQAKLYSSFAAAYEDSGSACSVWAYNQGLLQNAAVAFPEASRMLIVIPDDSVFAVQASMLVGALWQCPHLRSLQVRDFLWARHPWDVSTLRQLPDVTSLHYQLLGVDFPHAPVLLLLGLSGLSHLHTLHLDFKTFQDCIEWQPSHWQLLSGLVGLKELHIADRYNPYGLLSQGALQAMSQLTHLDLQGWVHAKELSHLAVLHVLRVLTLYVLPGSELEADDSDGASADHSRQWAGLVEQLPHLQDLFCQLEYPVPDLLSILSRLPSLSSLDVTINTRWWRTPTLRSFVAGAPTSLKALDLRKLTMDADSFVELGKLTMLDKLFLYDIKCEAGSNVSWDCSMWLTKLTPLRNLKLLFLEMHHADADSAQLPQLMLTDAVLAVLEAPWTALTRLHFHGMLGDDKGPALQRLPNLQVLACNNVQLLPKRQAGTEAAAVVPAAAPAANAAAATAAAAAASSKPSTSSVLPAIQLDMLPRALTTLSLTRISVSGGDVATIGQQCAQLVRISLCSCNVTNEHMAALAAHCHGLEALLLMDAVAEFRVGTDVLSFTRNEPLQLDAGLLAPLEKLRLLWLQVHPSLGRFVNFDGALSLAPRLTHLGLLYDTSGGWFPAHGCHTFLNACVDLERLWVPEACKTLLPLFSNCFITFVALDSGCEDFLDAAAVGTILVEDTW